MSSRSNPWLAEYYARYGSGGAPEGFPSICFVIGSPDISGGTNVIYQHAAYAQRAGCEVVIVPMLPQLDGESDWHAEQSGLKFATFEEVASKRFDIAIATWWPTVLELPRLRFRQAAYFVQSIESRFYAVGEGRPMAGLAELTYLLGLPTITIALWIQAYLAFEHDCPSFLVRNGIDKDVHARAVEPVVPRQPGRLRVLVEGSVDTQMKGISRSVDVAREAGVDEVWLLTSSSIEDYPGCDRVFSRIHSSATPSVYRSCDVLLKMSQVEGMFGPPLEMFHAGGTVVTTEVTGHDEYIVDGVNGIVIPVDDDREAVKALRSLRDQTLLGNLQRGAAGTARNWPDWAESSRDFLRVVSVIAKQDPPAGMLKMMLAAQGARTTHHQVTGVRW